jgi:hypothetical protein
MQNDMILPHVVVVGGGFRVIVELGRRSNGRAHAKHTTSLSHHQGPMNLPGRDATPFLLDHLCDIVDPNGKT